MIFKIKKRVERELASCLRRASKNGALENISPFIRREITKFLLRDGKRIRPTLFVLSYLGFAKNKAGGLYKSAASLELFHNFALIHDDIIDHSESRRGNPSMHAALNLHLNSFCGEVSAGEALAIVIGDMLYSMGVEALLAIDEKWNRKEMVLRDLAASACDTGCGQISEILVQGTPIAKISRKKILRIYSYKTARYTFAFPMAAGARLAGASESDVKKLFDAGLLLGTAFQIKDDILEILPGDKGADDYDPSDLREAKKTLLLWYAHKNSPHLSHAAIEKFLSLKKRGKSEIEKIRSVIISSGAVEKAGKDIEKLHTKATTILKKSGMQKKLAAEIEIYSESLLAMPFPTQPKMYK